MKRPKMSPEEIKNGIDEFLEHYGKIFKKKSDKSYASMHEIYGSLSEEKFEILMAMHDKDKEQFKRELLDLAVACIFGFTCLSHEE